MNSKMRILGAVGLLISSLTLVVGFVPAKPSKQTINFLNDEDDKLAASQILSALTAIGENAIKSDTEGTLVKWTAKSGEKFFIGPKTFKTGPNHIGIGRFFKVKPLYKNSDVLKDLISHAQKKISVFHYTLESEGSLLGVEATIFCLDTVELDLITSVCQKTLSAEMILAILKTLDANALNYLE